jgi:hypothetical protein
LLELAISLFAFARFAWLSVTQAQTGTTADVVAAITNLENDGVKADLAGDAVLLIHPFSGTLA